MLNQRFSGLNDPDRTPRLRLERSLERSLERRSVGRQAVDFYAIELAHGGRYLRRISNISGTGLLLEDRLNAQRPGEIMELELPRPDADPVRVKAEIVRITPSGHVGLRALDQEEFSGFCGTVDR